MVLNTTVNPETMKLAFEAAGQAMFEYSPAQNQFLWADPAAACSIFRIECPNAVQSADTVLGQLSDEHLIERQTVVDAAQRGDERSYSVEYRLGAEETGCWVEERGTWMTFGEEEKLIAVIRAIDDQRQREQRLSYLASYDELTGQLNRGRFKSLLESAIDGIKQGTRSGTLFLVGIDNVGDINSDFGFDVADQVIVEVAGRIERALGDEGIFGRVAGTKFGVVLKDGRQDTVLKMARSIMNGMREEVVLTRAGGVAVSVCIGATDLNDKTTSAATALAEGEAAFDQARRQGPSSFEKFKESTETISRRRRNTEISDVILTALNDRRVYLAYQPIVPDVNSPFEKYECLIRMRTEGGAEIPAPAFIPAAESLGLVHLLDRRVLELATQALLSVPEIKLNVNLSWETVKDPVWAEGYLAHLRANRRICDRLTIELTETQVMEAIEPAIEFVSAIKEVGCHFAIDDFGAGYTSFRNLKALDIDVLKID
ncbi:MAG: EAL domain-containing protein, partial [Pseudomonadota bacterium]